MNFEHFITVDPETNDRLMDGDREFRFIGMNPQNFDPLWMKGYPDWKYTNRLPDRYEIEDIIRTAAQMGATVVRDYTLSVGETKDGIQRHVSKPGSFSEEAFQRLDIVFEMCRKYQVRLILGFVDYQDNIGRIATYARWRDKEKSAFFSDPQIIADFKQTIDFVTDRYKNEKALLCWETGNEMPITAEVDEWVRDITAYTKKRDPNHLIEDGRLSMGSGISTDALTNPYIDIVSSHYYHWVQGIDYASYCKSDRALSKGKKVFIVEEFGYAQANLDIYHDLLDEAISNGTSGVMIWAMAQRNKNGGFFWHDGYDKGMGSSFWTYHWPGFESGNSYREIETFQLLRQHAYEIRKMEIPPLPIPDAPKLLPAETVMCINWRGSTGAVSYDIERAENINGPWCIVGADLSDAIKNYEALFSDISAFPGISYYYKMTAKNTMGVSDVSNIIGPLSL